LDTFLFNDSACSSEGDTVIGTDFSNNKAREMETYAMDFFGEVVDFGMGSSLATAVSMRKGFVYCANIQ